MAGTNPLFAVPQLSEVVFQSAEDLIVVCDLDDQLITIAIGEETSLAASIIQCHISRVVTLYLSAAKPFPLFDLFLCAWKVAFAILIKQGFRRREMRAVCPFRTGLEVGFPSYIALGCVTPTMFLRRAFTVDTPCDIHLTPSSLTVVTVIV